MTFPLSLGDIFPLRGSRRAAQLTRLPVAPKKARKGVAASVRPSRIGLETLEPRVLLSADISAAAGAAFGSGIESLGGRFSDFLASDTTLGERVPILLTVAKQPDGSLVDEAPTIRDLFSVPVDANGNGNIDFFGDEAALQALDTNNGGLGDGKVDANEFAQHWFYEPVANWFGTHGGSSDTGDFVSFLKAGFPFGLDQTLNDLSGLYKVEFSILDANKVNDTTQTPDAELTLTAGFELKVTSYATPIDLGLEADALKLLPFTGDLDGSTAPKLPTIPVTSTLDFAFDFGVLTGGKTTVTANDFFVRKAEPLALGVVSNAANLNFNLNIGFLGAQVNNGSIDLEADVGARLLDPNDPAVLGFTDAQRGAEQTGGVVTADYAVPGADLAHGAGFFLRIGNLGVATPVDVADNDRATLADLKSDVASALGSSGLGGLVDVTLTGGTTLRFALPSTSNNPLGYASESVGLTGELLGTPAGNGPNAFEYTGDQTFLLSVGGALPKLVTVHFPDPSHTEIGLNDGQAAAVPPLVAPGAASASDISADAGFTVTVWLNDGTTATKSITLHATDTDGNTTAASLAVDLDNAFTGSAVYPLVQATADGSGHLRFTPLNSSVSAIRVQASGTGTTEMGFAADAVIKLQLQAANNGVADLSQAANFRLTLDYAGVSSVYAITVPDNNRGGLAALAADIDAAIDAATGGNRLNVFVSGGKIVLAGTDTDDVRAFSVTTVNQNLNDLVVDVNRGLAQAGLAGQVTASAFGAQLRLLSTGAKSLEISRTLTFDAGRTYAELQQPVLFGDPDFGPLFGASKGTSSHVQLNLPVEILDGLDDATTGAVDNWKPANVAIVGNFSPFDANSTVSDYDASANRFDLKFTLNPLQPAQAIPPAPDLPPVGSVPSPASLTDKIVLVNFAEPLNFNQVGPESMIGLISSLGTALQQIADAQPFSKFDIPFATAKLSDLINIVDADKSKYSGLIDTLIYNTGGDGLNGPLADSDGLLKKVHVGTQDKLVPSFTTAQKLAARLSAILGVPKTDTAGSPPGINAAYDRISNQVTYRVDLLASDRNAPPAKSPFAYNVSLNPFGNLTVDAAAPSAQTTDDLNGRTGLQMTFGVDLSPPGSVILSTTTLAQLNGGKGVDIKYERAVTGTKSIPVVAAPGGGVQTPPSPIQQLLSGDASFGVSINGAAAVSVTIKPAATLTRTMAELVVDVDDALAVAHIGDKIRADFDGTRLVLSAHDNDLTTKFTIVNPNGAAITDLGFSDGMLADRADFLVVDRAGVQHRIELDTLSAASTVQQFFTLIGASTTGVVTAEFNATHTGLRLVDHSGGSSNALQVQTLNGAIALLQLGFHENRNIANSNPLPTVVEGGSIGSTRPLDERFFVRDAELRIDGLRLETPASTVPGQALFGIVGVDTHMGGSIQANVSAQLRNPDTKAPGSLVTLKQLFDRPGDAAAAPAVYTGQQIAYTGGFGQFVVGQRVVGTASHANAVVVNVDPVFGILQLADTEGTFQSGEGLVQAAAMAAAVSVGVVTTNANFGEFNLGVHVQDGFSEPGFGAGFALLDNQSYNVPIHLTGFGDPVTPTAPTAALDLSGIGDLAAFQKLGYDALSGALDGLLKVVQDVEAGFALLNTPLPAINRSVSDLLGLVAGFASGVHNADAALDASKAALAPGVKDLPALRLQDIPRALRSAFGLPEGVDPSAPGSVDWVRLDFDKAANMLRVELSLDQAVSTQLGLDIVTGGGLPDVTSGGVLKLSGTLDTRLNFGIDLADPTKAWLFDTSNISASLHVEGEGRQYTGGQRGLGLVFRAALGPLDVFIQDGDALIDVSFKLPGLDFDASGKKLISAVTFGDWKPPVIDKNSIDISLPMFFGGEGPDNFIGEYKATGPIAGVVVTTPNFASIASGIQSGSIAFDPFSNILLAIDGLDIYLQTLSDTLSSDVLGNNLPFVGDQMADVLVIEDFRNTLIRTLKNGIENAVNPTPDLVQTFIAAAVLASPGVSLAGGVSYTHSNDPSTPAANRFKQWTFTLNGTKTLTLDDFVLGIPNLGFDIAEPVLVTLDWQIKLGFGVDFTNSAYVVLPSGTDDVDLKLAITLPGGTHAGQLGYLPVNVTDPGSDTGARLDFDVDVKDGSTLNTLLPFSDLGAINSVATVNGTDLSGSSNHIVSLKLVTNAAPGLPQLGTDLILDWSLAAGTPVAGLDGDAVAPGVAKIALNNVSLDAGSVAKQLLGPAFSDIADFIKPFMPVVDTLSARIPILSDIAGTDITLLDLAAIFGHVDGDFIKAVADVANVISSIDSFISAPAQELQLGLGSITLFDAAAGISNFDPLDPSSQLSKINVLIDGHNDPSTNHTTTQGLVHDASAYNAKINGNAFLRAVRDQTLAKDLLLPILTDPRQGFMMLLNQPATLVSYALPPLDVDFSYLQVFPVFGPLAVSITISFGFGVDLHGIGFDTYGYQRYAAGGFRDPGVIFDGFFFNDLDASKTDAPEITLQFGLIGAAELNLGIARAGVQGGIDALITFNWHDSIPDTHVHLSEIAGNIVAEGGNPLAAFDVGGELTFSLSAFLEISLIGFHQDFPITGEQTLYSFDDTSKRLPVLAKDIGGGTLQLNMGPNAQDRLNGDISDGNEYFELRRVGTDVYVWSDKLGVPESKKQVYHNVSHIVGLGGQGDDTILLHDFDGGNITAEFDGGVGDDHIEYMGSTGSRSVPGAVIRGGLGNDTLIGGDANDVIYGGQGNDIIEGGGGYDILFGDGGRVADTLTPMFISSRVALTDGDDMIEGGDGDDVLIGGGGNDKLVGDGGNDILIGDGGRFEYTTTGGHVDVTALRPAPYVPTPVTDTSKTPAQISSDIDTISDFVTGKFTATDLGFGGNDTLSGGADDDLILGGSGDDTINGDAGADVILGGKGFDDIHGGAGNDAIFGGDQADTIAGDADNDVISGGTGNDFIHGNDGADVMKGDAGADVMFGDAGNDQVFGLTEPDVLFGGTGDDLVVGGTGNDIIFGDDGLVAKLDPGHNASLDVIIGNGSAAPATGAFRDGDKRTLDLIVTDVVAGDGNDMLSGEAGDDLMLGGGGNDLMGGDVDPRLADVGVAATPISRDVMIGDGGKITFDERQFCSIETVVAAVGSPYNDTIYGDNGNDYIFGGQGDDFLFGGHGKVVTGGFVGTFRRVTDPGASDNDIIVGDNGKMEFANKTIPANFGKLERVQTTDLSNATGGDEYAEGELGNDVVFGGVNDPVDVLFGNAGSDVILGDNGVLDFDFNDPAHDLSTLDLIRSYRDGLGGEDHISGNAGSDVLIGGTDGDLMYGDDATGSAGALDGEDIMLGDNADIFLVGTVGRLTVKVAAMPVGTAIDLITTSDRIDLADPLYDSAAKVDAFGGADTMSGNASNDIMLGGVNNGGTDLLYGDIAATTVATIANDGNDIELGDNGLLDFTFDADADRLTLDLIRSAQDGLGGTDILSGNKGLDVAIGGTGGDTIYGDDAGFTAAAADLSDLLIGDNADIFLVAKGAASGGDLKDVLGVAVQTIRTTDKDHPEYGGSDTISGNAGGDIILGGVQGDTLYGDRQAVTTATNTNDGNDIILGDNGALEWQSNGRLSEISGIDINANNAALWAKFGNAVQDLDLTTLDLITTEQPTNGGRDLVYGDNGRDTIFGGTDSDRLYGDTGSETDGNQSANGNDLMFGDHGRLYVQFSRFKDANGNLVAATDINSRNFFAIDIGNAATADNAGGQGDRMWGEEGDDIMLGQQGDDRMWGGSGSDDMVGGHNVSGGYDELTVGAIAATLKAPDNGMNDLMDGGSGDDAMTGDNAIVWRRGDDLSPRFRSLTALTIYTTDASTITTNVGSISQSDPNDAVGRDIQLVDHADNTLSGLYGKDVMAGGAGNDTMFGELGDDLMQGDGSIDIVRNVQPATRQIDVTDSAGPTGQTLYFNVPEAGTDGDDYMEGNGGRDLMYGGLGQDDMIGGSSALFGLTTEDLRPDGSDTMFGGAGIRTARNDLGMATDTGTAADGSTKIVVVGPDGHARDADFMMGDNANVYRLVKGGASGTNKTDPNDVFLSFNYDDLYGLQLVPRAMQLLDYTLGGGDFNPGGYNMGQATVTGKPADNGAADLIHGESGDDIIFGMTGSDVLFGEGQDDDIVGGYGHDWISGGTGQDGVLGDDGLIYTSRNSTTGEALYGVAGLNAASTDDTKYSNGNVLDELITTPGSLQSAVINRSGELKKTIDVVPFSYDKTWIARDDEFPNNADTSPFADDIIFGGLGSDFLHGGSGDDAISGAEALAHAYVPTYDAGTGLANGVLDLGYSVVGIANALVVNPTTQDPGNVLAFNPNDLDGQHLNNRFRAGEFRLYDEYDPRRKIMLTDSGELDKTGGGFNFLLNFDKDEGVLRPAGTVPKATGQQTESYPAVHDDGADAIFGDLGNDWIVGGTGRDNLYGGWGNDLLQADDNLDTETVGVAAPFDNESPDTHPTYEDRAYGGAGRDVLIGNTGGDRLIDWVGEYNSYLVPYAPFGQASVSRTLQPFLPEFLYALSAGDGADPTRYRDAIGTNPPQPTNNNPNPSRNGEPYGELGLALQKDFAWGDQTGAPADPQAGNIPGGPRDVLRSADFAGNNASGFVAAAGSWQVTNNAYEVAPAGTASTDAISLFDSDVTVPSYFEVTATINALKPVGGFKANAYIIFDYYSATDFKFAGIDVSTNKIQIGQRASWGFQVLAMQNMILKAGTDYNLLLAINGSAVQLVVNNAQSVSYAFTPRKDSDGFTYGISAGMYGLGADYAKARIDNVVVQRIPPKTTLALSDGFTGGTSTLLTPYTGNWALQADRLNLTPQGSAPFALAGNDIAVGVAAMLKLDTVVSTTGTGGLVFDLYSPTDFKWAAISTTSNQVLVGHYTAKGGWVVDAAVAKTISSGDIVALSVTLKGSTVSVSLNGQVVLSRVYNAPVVDGAAGVFSRGGTSSFDSFGLQTDDARFAPAPTMTATSVARQGESTTTASASTTSVTTPSSTLTTTFAVTTQPQTDTTPAVKLPVADTAPPTAGGLSLAVAGAAPPASGIDIAAAGRTTGETVLAARESDDSASALAPAETLRRAREPEPVPAGFTPEQAAETWVIDWTPPAEQDLDAVLDALEAGRPTGWQADFVTTLGTRGAPASANSALRFRL